MKVLVKLKKKPKIIRLTVEKFQELSAIKIQCFFRIILARNQVFRRLDDLLCILKIRCAKIIQSFARKIIAKNSFNRHYIKFINTPPFKYFLSIKDADILIKKKAFEKSINISKRLILLRLFKKTKEIKSVYVACFLQSLYRYNTYSFKYSFIY